MSQVDIQVGAILRRYELLAESGGAKANIVADAILHCVENGYWRPDERMPAEQVLAEALPVSLGTIQAAYRRLAADGIVARRRKGGTRLTSRVDVELRLNTTVAGDQTRPTMVVRTATDFLATWSSAGQDGSQEGIYGQRFAIAP